MTYYVKKDNKIIFINKSLQRLKDMLIFRKDITDDMFFETDKKLIEHKGEFKFEDEIKDELLKEAKESKIKELDNFLINIIINKIKEDYNIDIDFKREITLQSIFKICRKLNKSLEEIIKLIENLYNNTKTIQNNLEDKINNLKTIKKIKEFDIEEEFFM